MWRLNVTGYSKTYLRSSCKVSGILSNFNQIWPLLTSCHNVPNTKYHGNPSFGSRADPCGQTDGYDEPKRRFAYSRVGLHKATQNQDEQHTAQYLHLRPTEYK
jgi:hypothetical protein